MFLYRIGKKTAIAQKIIQHFPPHKCFIDMFFGAGGLYFNKPLAKYNFCNDLDDEVINCFDVAVNRGEELVEFIETAPYCQSLFKYWLRNKETDPVRKALRFIFLSNYSYLGAGNTIKIGRNTKAITIAKIKEFMTSPYMKTTNFLHCDYRQVLKTIDKELLPESLIYADPPYLDTHGYDGLPKWTSDDSVELFNILISSSANFAISEFDHPFITQLANKNNLNVIEIGEQQALKARKKEILITNFQIKQPTLF